MPSRKRHARKQSRSKTKTNSRGSTDLDVSRNIGAADDRVSKMLELFETTGNKAEVARILGCARSTVSEALSNYTKPFVGGRKHPLATKRMPLPPKGKVYRFIVTCAQSNTHVHTDAFNNLSALADHYKAELLISQFTYDKTKYGKRSVKPGKTNTDEDLEDVWFDPLVDKYVCNDRVQLAPGLIFCGELNLLPTATNPLSGLETITGMSSGIFPHSKVAMRSVATGKYEETKHLYTTGTITQRNYVAKKDGFKAEFHHTYGALLVEVDSDGDWFVRQVNCDDKGTIFDLDVCVSKGKIETQCRVRAINWGDIHRAQVCPDQVKVMADLKSELRPEYQICHDLLDCLARNPHYARHGGKPHQRFRSWKLGYDIVEDEIQEVADWINDTTKNDMVTVVVSSNHDRGLFDWLKFGDYRTDPANALFFLRAQLYAYETLDKNPDASINILGWAIERILGKRKDVIFLDEDQSFILDDVELGMHGHNGPNGSRGTPTSFSKMARKATIGHVHSPGIWDGLYAAGFSGTIDQGYNVGPGSWAPAHVIQYKNGKRTMIVCRGRKYRASGSSAQVPLKRSKPDE